MKRFILVGVAAVLSIACLKTLLVVYLVIGVDAANIPQVLSLFTIFTLMTGIVALFAYRQMSGYIAKRRKDRLAPGAGKPAEKETVLAQYAATWGLSQAEADVAIFVVKGFSNSEIADMRGCALATVKTQLGRIYHKSGLETRYQLISFVTDEVLAMAKNQGASSLQRIETRKILPLVGRSKQAKAEPARLQA